MIYHLFVVVVLFLSACHEESFQSAGSGSGHERGAELNQADGADAAPLASVEPVVAETPGPAPAGAVEPVVISGAYLACAPVLADDGAGSVREIGCGVFDEEGSPDRRGVRWSGYAAPGVRLTARPSLGTAWQVFFRLEGIAGPVVLKVHAMTQSGALDCTYKGMALSRGEEDTNPCRPHPRIPPPVVVPDQGSSAGPEESGAPPASASDSAGDFPAGDSAADTPTDQEVADEPVSLCAFAREKIGSEGEHLDKLCVGKAFTPLVYESVKSPWTGQGQVADMPLKVLHKETRPDVTLNYVVTGLAATGPGLFHEYYQAVGAHPAEVVSGDSTYRMTTLCTAREAGKDEVAAQRIRQNITSKDTRDVDFDRQVWVTRIGGEEHAVILDRNNRFRSIADEYTNIWFVLPAAGGGSVFLRYDYRKADSIGSSGAGIARLMEDISRAFTHHLVLGRP